MAEAPEPATEITSSFWKYVATSIKKLGNIQLSDLPGAKSDAEKQAEADAQAAEYMKSAATSLWKDLKPKHTVHWMKRGFTFDDVDQKNLHWVNEWFKVLDSVAEGLKCEEITLFIAELNRIKTDTPLREAVGADYDESTKQDKLDAIFDEYIGNAPGEAPMGVNIGSALQTKFKELKDARWVAAAIPIVESDIPQTIADILALQARRRGTQYTGFQWPSKDTHTIWDGAMVECLVLLQQRMNLDDFAGVLAKNEQFKAFVAKWKMGDVKISASFERFGDYYSAPYVYDTKHSDLMHYGGHISNVRMNAHSNRLQSIGGEYSDVSGDGSSLLLGGVVGASAVVIIMLIFCLGLAFGMIIYWGYSQKRALDVQRKKGE
eukprot:1106170_1